MSILQIGAAVDVAAIKAGMAQATADTKSAASQMSSSFAQMAAESEQATTTVSEGWLKVAQSSLVYSKARSEVTSASRAAKKAEDDDGQALAQLALAQQRATVASTELREAQRAVGGAVEHTIPQYAAASAAVRAFDGTLSVRAAERFLTTVLDLGPALQKIFPVIGAFAFVDILGTLAGKIGDVMDSLAGLDAEAKTLYGDLVDQSNKWVLENLKVADAQDKAGEAALTGAAKIHREVEDNTASAKRYAAELGNAQRELRDAQAEVEKYQLTLKNWFTQSGIVREGELKQAKEERDRLQKKVDDLTAETRRRQQAVPQLQTTLGIENERQAREATLAGIEAERKARQSEYQSRVELARQGFQLSQITLEQEVLLLETAEQQKYQAELRYYEQRKALALREQRETGKPAAPVIAGLNVDEANAHEEMTRRNAAVDAEAEQERKRHAEEVSRATIEAAKQAADTQISLEQRQAQQAYESRRAAAVQQISLLNGAAQEETAALISAENERTTARRKELADELALAKQDPYRNAAQIVTINAQIEEEETIHQANLARIRAEGQQKAAEDQRRILQDEKRDLEERVSFAEQTANRTYQAEVRFDDLRLKNHELTRGQWYATEKTALDSWYSMQHATLERALADAKNLFGQESDEYQKLKRKESELDQEFQARSRELQEQRLQAWRQATEQMTGALFSGINQWIQGQKTFGQAMIQTWNQLVLDVIKDIEQIAAKWIAEHVLMAAIQKILGVGSGNTAQVATNSAANVAIATSDANAAAAAAFESAMVALPFPVNVAVAPALAASTLATGMGFAAGAAFEQGGIVPSTGMALVHGGEMVLPRPISETVQQMAANGGSLGGGPAALHVHYAPTIHASGSGADFPAILAKHADHIGRIVNRQLRQFNR